MLGAQMWQSAMEQVHPANPNANREVPIQERINQIFNSMPFFPELTVEDPYATPHFKAFQPEAAQKDSPSQQEKQILIQPEQSPLGSIAKRISTALEILKSKDMTTEQGAIPIDDLVRVDSIWLETVRAVEFSVDHSETLILLCPKNLV
ncbi:hypothetical protein A4A49_35903 [Nicotiana attenuata]|uniref:Uncharacterized protein n=1 Tax=Nicotiana attenuata TaxID=49451 RepID=A0A1J6JX27_NICAT|nr:hypothetical protein A4A49_35903 [Nicotiana attenuata]